MAASRQHLYTVKEFEEFIAQSENRARLLELVNGEIVEKVPTEEHGEVALTMGAALREFVVKNKLGRVGVEIRHQLPHDKVNSRLPDISFIAGQRARVTDGSVPRMPDLAVEIKSRDDSLKELREKANYYLLNGTRLVWIVDLAKRLVIVLTPDEEQILLENEILSGGDVLPGFSMPVHDIFADPMSV